MEKTLVLIGFKLRAESTWMPIVVILRLKRLLRFLRLEVLVK